MLVTLSGIVILVRFVQSENARSPMLATLSGIVIFVRREQLVKASSAIITVPYFTS